MRRVVVVLTMSVMATLAALLPASPAGAQPDDFLTACPQLTDSVYRLYSAYFLREPDQAGWDYWVDVYGSRANTNLEVISDSFARSDEFRLRYGPLSNTDFVRLVYRNVLGREADQGGLDHWVGSLNRGYPRGSVMMAFSESEEYVNRTATTLPLAGYLMWYDRALQFDCGLSLSIGVPGDKEQVAVPAGIPTPYADILLANITDLPTVSSVILLFPGYGQTIASNVTLQPGEYLYLYNVPVPRGAYQITFNESATLTDPDLLWSVAFYDHPHAGARPGWD